MNPSFDDIPKAINFQTYQIAFVYTKARIIVLIFRAFGIERENVFNLFKVYCGVLMILICFWIESIYP